MSEIKSKSRNEKISDILFYLAFGVFLIAEILTTCFYWKYFTVYHLRIARYTWLILLVIREFFIAKEYNIPTLIRLLFHNIKWLIAFAVIIIFTLVLKFVTSNDLILFALIFGLCARNMDFKRIAKFSFWIILCTVAVIIISSYIGIIDNYTYTTATRTRQALGFLICLYPSMYFFTLTALYLFFRDKHITWIELVVLILGNVWMFLQTRSRLAFIISILIILVFAFLKIKPEFFKTKKILCGVLVLSFAICFVISFALVMMYSDSSPIMVQLNDLLNERLSLLQNSISNNGIHLFGHQLIMIGNGLNAVTGQKTTGEYSYVDSYCVQFLLRNGIIFTVIWLALLTATMYLLYKSGNYPLLICMTFVAIGWTIDDILGRPGFNPFLIIVGIPILQRFMSQHSDYPKLFPGNDGGLVSGLNRICSWKPLQ